MNKKQRTPIVIVRFVVLLGYLLMVLAPFYWLFITSLKPKLDILTTNIQYWPKHITFDNYIYLFETSNFAVFFKNSIILSLATGFFGTCLAVLGGYAMARFKFRGHKLVIYGLLLTQLIPGVLVLVPTIIMYSKLGLTNTMGGLILFYTVGTIPFSLILMRNFFDRIPMDLEEAALIDGCNKMQSLFKIILPLMVPGVIATFIFAFIGAWNDLLGAVMIISSDSLKTIPVGLNMFIHNYDIDWGVMTAGGIAATVPSLIMFAVMQRFVVEGLTDGAVKG
ncbi:sugar ABC transporter permease [Paenibacillus baekrokdamisoli]|uniref:Sugar ABC transporter permease n=1 Tax=Paenibacillus baekrokdamisoli TaxID=1712516 RepID=A0A3G9JN41_9BACL|nr:carbohydrate ABC transporter permease [Paenibacillus baekrokdamisoli]MBB3073209.1 multiple sugar transport system permease protein [Paenibacillus baekrokdamisoli]BBH24284.1 sugar ABC transporter permease [Paenibacillus baekrokdamisoli]